MIKSHYSAAPANRFSGFYPVNVGNHQKNENATEALVQAIKSQNPGVLIQRYSPEQLEPKYKEKVDQALLSGGLGFLLPYLNKNDTWLVATGYDDIHELPNPQPGHFLHPEHSPEKELKELRLLAQIQGIDLEPKTTFCVGGHCFLTGETKGPGVETSQELSPENVERIIQNVMQQTPSFCTAEFRRLVELAQQQGANAIISASSSGAGSAQSARTLAHA